MKTMDCKDVLANLSCYIDGEGSYELRRALEEHIARCRRCRVVFDSTDKMLKVVTDADPFEVPLSVSARLYTRLEKVLSERKP
jgi:predicted anti-sigma-YlaC factor YlaD